MAKLLNAPLISRQDSQEASFSLIELLIVFAVVAIVTAISFFTLAPHKRSYRADDAALQVENFLRDAYHRALSQRQVMRVQIDRANQIISIIDENKLPVGDEREVRRDSLTSEINFDQPAFAGTPVTLPPAPYAYPAATYNSSVWVARFRSDGSVVDSSGNSLSAALFFRQ